MLLSTLSPDDLFSSLSLFLPCSDVKAALEAFDIIDTVEVVKSGYVILRVH